MTRKIGLLQIDDVEPDAELVALELRRVGYDVASRRVDTLEGLRTALLEAEWDLCVSDFSLPGFSAREALAIVRARAPDLPFIVVSGSIGEEAAVEAMRAGAQDYFAKDRLGKRFGAAVERELREAQVRRQARISEAALSDSRSMVELLLSSTHFMLYACQADGNLDVNFVTANVTAVLGYPAEAFYQPRFWQDRIHPADAPAVFERLEHLRERGGAAALEYRFKHQNGAWRWMQDHVTLRQEPAEAPKMLLGAWADVTEQRQIREQLMISDRMASIGTLAAGLAHEINNPLAAAMSNLEFLAQDLDRLRSGLRRGGETAASEALDRLKELEEPLSDARLATNRIRHLVRDLKVFSRSNEEKVTAVDPRLVLDSSLRMATNEIKHRARLVKDYAEVPHVLGNESRLGQVFLNLVVNAAQAMTEGHADQNELRAVVRPEGSGRVAIEVRDTGTGIPRELLARIFDPFVTTKSIGVGTGLGLSICHRIVESLGGEIQVESEVGKGSVFRVLLPAATEIELDAPAPPPPVPAPSHRGKILVVDDEPALAAAMRRVLELEHEVVTTTSAREALERIARGERFDVLICDLMMPELTGMDLHAELLRAAPDQTERMVFMTGGAFTSRAHSFLNEVRNPRLDKPIDSKALLALVQGLLR